MTSKSRVPVIDAYVYYDWPSDRARAVPGRRVAEVLLRPGDGPVFRIGDDLTPRSLRIETVEGHAVGALMRTNTRNANP